MNSQRIKAVAKAFFFGGGGAKGAGEGKTIMLIPP